MWLLGDLLCVHHFKVAFFHSLPKGSDFREKCWKLTSRFLILVDGNLDLTEWVPFHLHPG